MSRTTTEPSYVALGSDGSILEQGGDIYARQDPASTTKLWTLYTVLAMVRDGHLPRSFVNEHRHDLEHMMIYSDNQASERIAVAADRATGGNGRVSNGELDAVPGFAEWMNRYANGDLASERISLDDTNFVTASGMPHQQHYSTAHDMALMMLRFRTDFEGSSVEEYRGMAGMSSSTVRAGNGTELSKTGTARGYHGSRGRYSFVGATDDGVYSVAGSATKGDRQTLNRRLARRTHDSDVSFDDIDRATSALGYKTYKSKKTFHQRNFASREEKLSTLDRLNEMSINPTGLETEGSYYANLYLSLPSDIEFSSLPEGIKSLF